MKIKLIAEASGKDERRLRKWGLSFLAGEDLLFDTFSDPDTLRYNFMQYNIDIQRIKYVVISHEHWDHTGGLWWFLQENNNVKVYILHHFSDTIKKRIKEYGCRLIEVGDAIQIKDNVFTTGELCGTYNNGIIYEQSLIIKEQKLTIITGCSHPGLLSIINHVITLFPCKINLIAGGFHLSDKTDKEIINLINDSLFTNNVEKIAPLHCTGGNAIKLFLKAIPHKIIDMNTGTIIDTAYLAKTFH
ncbi:MAG: MBL fold metallo-hydrolase [Spirochaetales bacterium]|nr:MBL fold metallo-hydrolase [Spirochaetales bacterium]